MMSVEEGVRLSNPGEEDEDDTGHDARSLHSVSVSSVSQGTSYIGKPQEPDTVSLLIENLINNSNESHVWLLTLVLALGNAADAIEIMCIGFIMTEIPNITTQQKEYLSAAVFLGMLFGGIICGSLSDYVGRRPCLLYSLGLNALAGYASACAPDVTALIACRVIGGLGIGGSVPVVFSLGAEMFPSPVRGKLLSVLGSFWMVGAIFTASFAWIMLGSDFSGQKIMPNTGWRSFAAVCATPAMITFFLTLLCTTESPRFLVGKKKYSEAAAALQFMTNVPVRPFDLMRKRDQEAEEGEEGWEGGKGTREGLFVTASNSTVVFLFSPALLKTTIVLLVIWFTLCFGSYGISTWISELFVDVGVSNAFEDAFIFALANLPGNIISIMYVETVGRRSLLAYGMAIAAMAAFGFAIDTKHKETVVFFAALFNAFSTVGWNSLDCLSVESFPTKVRTSAMGILAAAGRLGAIAAQFVNGQLEENVPMLLFVTSVCMVVGGASSWLLDNDNTGTALAEEFVSDEPGNIRRDRIQGYASVKAGSGHTTHNPLSEADEF
jgi:MFS family permease